MAEERSVFKEAILCPLAHAIERRVGLSVHERWVGIRYYRWSLYSVRGHSDRRWAVIREVVGSLSKERESLKFVTRKCRALIG